MDYQPGDEILKLTDNPSTLQDCGIGPFHMTQVCRNGSISIQHISHFVEHINICQVKPPLYMNPFLVSTSVYTGRFSGTLDSLKS